MEMLEKVARAIEESDGEGEKYEDQAKAAINALLEPTPEMIKAACMNEDDAYTHNMGYGGPETGEEYQVMLREALKE